MRDINGKDWIDLAINIDVGCLFLFVVGFSTPANASKQIVRIWANTRSNETTHAYMHTRQKKVRPYTNKPYTGRQTGRICSVRTKTKHQHTLNINVKHSIHFEIVRCSHCCDSKTHCEIFRLLDFPHDVAT